MAIDPGRLMGGTPGRRRQMAEEKRVEQGAQKPIDNSHSHSKQESQNGAMGSLGSAFGGGTGSQNPNTNLAEIGRNAFNGIGVKRKNMNNNFTNPDSQRIASGMFQGQDLENQMAQRRSTPTPVPGGRPDQDISPLMQAPYPHNDPKGSDASFGIKGYVTNQEEYTQAKQEQNNPYVYKAKDDLADKNMKQYNEAKNKKEKRKAVMDSEKRGDEAINN